MLASASPARAATLRSAGIEPLIRVSNADEDAVLARFDNADSAEQATQKVVALAEAKAAAVVPLIGADELLSFAAQTGMAAPTEAIVVACDSMLEVDGALLGKPHSPEVAFERIRKLSGNDVTLHTGHTVVHLQISAADRTVKVSAERSGSCATTVHFTELDDDEIRAYIATGEPLEVAGSFTIDGLGGPFIAGVTGDPHSVVGISLPLVRQIAKEVGVFWPSLWNRK
ncbi:MAG: Maf family protein [Actinomycetaceae bacterium]|nr:Maf family protein [Actinomycetaceae bacterium]